jgi:AbrB family looped-hinge helix DNA binding protein
MFTVLGFLVTKYFKIKTLKKVTVISILDEIMAKIIGSSKVTKRYQVTIPNEARKILKISVGDTLAFVEENGKVFITTKI